MYMQLNTEKYWNSKIHWKKAKELSQTFGISFSHFLNISWISFLSLGRLSADNWRIKTSSWWSSWGTWYSSSKSNTLWFHKISTLDHNTKQNFAGLSSRPTSKIKYWQFKRMKSICYIEGRKVHNSFSFSTWEERDLYENFNIFGALKSLTLVQDTLEWEYFSMCFCWSWLDSEWALTKDQREDCVLTIQFS